MVCSGSRKCSLLKTSHDECAEKLLGLIITIPQVNQQHLTLIHDLADVDVILLLPQHVEDAWVIGQCADLVGSAAHHRSALSTPTVELVCKEGIAIGSHFGVGDLGQLLGAEIIISE